MKFALYVFSIITHSTNNFCSDKSFDALHAKPKLQLREIEGSVIYYHKDGSLLLCMHS